MCTCRRVLCPRLCNMYACRMGSVCKQILVPGAMQAQRLVALLACWEFASMPIATAQKERRLAHVSVLLLTNQCKQQLSAWFICAGTRLAGQ